MLDSVKRLLDVVKNGIYNSVKIKNKCFGLIAAIIRSCIKINRKKRVYFWCVINVIQEYMSNV